MRDLDFQIRATLSALVVGASVTALVKAVGQAFGRSNLTGGDGPSARVRAACERLSERGEVLRREHGHPYYVMEPAAALEVLRGLDASELCELSRALGGAGAGPRGRSYDDGTSWWTEARIAVASGDSALIRSVCARASRAEHYIDREAMAWVSIVGETPPAGLLEQFSDAVANEYCVVSFAYVRRWWKPIAPAVLERLSAAAAKTRREIAGYVALRGDFERARGLAGSNKEALAGIEVIEAFTSGALKTAAEVGLDACTALKRKNNVLRDEAGLLHALACIAVSSNDPRCMPHAQAAVLDGEGRRRFYVGCYSALIPVVSQNTNGHVRYGGLSGPGGGMELYVRALCALWSGASDSGEPPQFPETWSQWAALAADAPPLHALMQELERAYAEPGNPGGIAGAFVPRAAWEVSLDALEVSIQSLGESGTASAKLDTILWVLAGRTDDLHIECRIRGPRSRKGRKVSLHTLMKKAEAEDLIVTPSDRAILDACVVERDEWTGKRFAQFTPRALCALAGHRRLEDEQGQAVTVTREMPRLVLETTESGATLSVDPPRLVHEPVALLRRDGSYTVYERPAAWKPLLGEFPSGTLAVPAGGIPRLERLVASLAEQEEFTVAGLSFGDRTVEADPRVLARLVWDGDVLSVEFRSAPFGPDGPHYPIAQGSEDAVRRGPDGLVGARRRFEDEARRARELSAVLPGDWSEGADRSIDDLEEALAVVEILEGLGDAILRAWPAKRLRVRSGFGGADSLKVKVHSADEWFSADVSLRVDEHLVLGFERLMRGREGGGRYVSLGENEYLALTTAMARRLDTLRAFSSDRDKLVRVHPAAAESVGLTEETPGVQLDAACKARLSSIRDARALQPRLPRKFGATLRAYQREGFQWLARLCAAGLGGCLADDMGLGKTVQSLALLCLRRKEGPALVVCPTSVVANWQDECARFAPELRVVTLGPTERARTLEGLSRGDLLILSYGLLVREQEALAQIQFGTAVFDEAHALKSATSQRAKAAFCLNAKARVTLTGTPVENHLGELWSVMHATVPGMLGSKRHFDERLGRPVLKHHAGALDRLRAILDPFVLRRRRAEVLTELPALTEVTVRIPPTDAQAAYYELLRKRAVEALETARSAPGQERIRVLAEITRLRQAAIDPRLLEEDLAPAGSKLDEACERIASLSADGHRCLVFTQFLGCIRRLNDQLSERGLEVLTLDGSTPAPLRKARIDAFQRGEADVFVMSLKAGGVGINLTAAQYVIHMDPWWNPAVEDQATARSHRMGQRDPVTVYRLITEGSIEERILDLHDRKRSLAEDLLGGMDTAQPLDLDALRGLLDA